MRCRGPTLTRRAPKKTEPKYDCMAGLLRKEGDIVDPDIERRVLRRLEMHVVQRRQVDGREVLLRPIQGLHFAELERELLPFSGKRQVCSEVVAAHRASAPLGSRLSIADVEANARGTAGTRQRPKRDARVL
jgi:hypothetical protein